MWTKISSFWRQWSLNFLWLTLLGCVTDKLYEFHITVRRHGRGSVKNWYIHVFLLDLDPPLISRLVFFFLLTNHLQTPRRQRSSDWSCIVIFWVKCCVFRLKLFELIRTKFTFFKTNNKLFMPPPNINQSIFYAMLRWSKDNPNSHNFKWPKPPSSLSFQSLCCRFNTLPLGSQCLLDKILFF